MGATTVSLMDGHIWIWAGKYTVGIRTRVRSAVGPLFQCYTYTWFVWLGFAKTHTYPVWGMTTLRQFRSPPAAPVPVLSHWSITAIENAQSGV